MGVPVDTHHSNTVIRKHSSADMVEVSGVFGVGVMLCCAIALLVFVFRSHLLSMIV